jgi:hypothetical protein
MRHGRANRLAGEPSSDLPAIFLLRHTKNAFPCVMRVGRPGGRNRDSRKWAAEVVLANARVNLPLSNQARNIQDRSTMKKQLMSAICLCAFAGEGFAQGPSLSFPNAVINVQNYGALGDAQESNAGCTVSGSTLTCSTGQFTYRDIGKSIQIPAAGSTVPASPAPRATFETTITTVSTADASGRFTTVGLASTPSASPGGVIVTWGTDNTAAIQNALNACPPAVQPTFNLMQLSPFTSKGCVIVLPSPGTAGTGD